MLTYVTKHSDAAAIPHDRFLRLVAGGLASGIFAAASLGAAASFLFTVAAGRGSLELVFAGLQFAILVFITTSVAGFFLSLIPFGPLAYFVARRAYRMGLRERPTYALLGAATAALAPVLVGIATLLSASLDDFTAISPDMAILVPAWFAASGAAGGATFAKALSHEERRQDVTNVF